GVKQATFVWVLTGDARERCGWNTVGDLLPGLAEVARLVEIRSVVVPLVHRCGDVSSSRIVWRRFDRVDLNPFRHQIFVGRYVRPVFSAVARQLNQTII